MTHIALEEISNHITAELNRLGINGYVLFNHERRIVPELTQQEKERYRRAGLRGENNTPIGTKIFLPHLTIRFNNQNDLNFYRISGKYKDDGENIFFELMK